MVLACVAGGGDGIGAGLGVGGAFGFRDLFFGGGVVAVAVGSAGGIVVFSSGGGVGAASGGEALPFPLTSRFVRVGFGVVVGGVTWVAPSA